MGFSAFSGGGRFEALQRTVPREEENSTGAGAQGSVVLGFFGSFLHLKIKYWSHGNKGSTSSMFF